MNDDLYNSVKPLIDYNLSIKEKLIGICEPLFNNFGVTYFEYDHILKDGRVFYISTNKDWLHFSLESKMFDDPEHVRLCSIARHQNYRYAFWNCLKLEDTALLSKYYNFDIWNGLSINEVEDGAFHIYSFATSKDNAQLNNFFINNLKLLDRFIIYFKNKLASITENAPIFPLIKATPLIELAAEPKILDHDKNIKSFLEQTELKNFNIKLPSKSVNLTKREIECLHMTSLGKTMKEIGSQLAISPKTVENHINSIKTKTGLIYRNDMISFFQDSPLRQYSVY